MNSPWTYSTTGFQLTGKSHEEICRLCEETGLAGIEGAPPLFEGLNSGEVAEIGPLYKKRGLKLDSFHLPFKPEDDIASFYTTIRQGAVDTMKRWMECAAALGSRVVIQHPTTTRFDVDAEGLDLYLKNLDKSLSALLPRAEELGLILALENMLPGNMGRMLGSRPAHFEAFHKHFAHPHLGFCLDTGHALVAEHENANAFFEAMKPALTAFHLADNAGDRDSHLAPGHGRVDWASVFRGMKEIGFEQVACIETPPFDFGPDFTAAAWRKMVEDTDRLADKALNPAAS